MTEQIKERLRALPNELFVAREQEYESFKDHRAAKEKLEEEEALSLQRHPPQGKNADERKRAGVIALSQDGNITHYRNHVRSTADTLADRKRDTQKLVDRFSSLRYIADLTASENIRDAAGTPSATSAGIKVGIKRAIGDPF